MADDSNAHIPSDSWLAAFARLRRLALKETREILRDRRTLVTLIGMPILLYPVLSLVFQQFFLTTKIEKTVYHVRIGFETEEQLNFAALYMRSVLPDQKKQQEQQEKKFDVALVHQPRLVDALNAGEIDVGIHFLSKLPDQVDPVQSLALDWELLYVESNAMAMPAIQELKRNIDDANATFVFFRMRSVGIHQRPRPVEIQTKAIGKATKEFPISLDAVIPLILILMTITGAVYPAIDLTAGERERGTLEILVAAPVSRLSLLMAKYFAVVSVAMLTAGINLIAMGTTIFASGIGAILFQDKGISVTVLAQVFCLLVLFAAFFSGILLALTSFARSFKEAQAYLIPLMLAAMAPGVLSLLPGLELNQPLAAAPLLNIVLLARDLMGGKATPMLTGIVVLTTSLYSFLSIAIAARVFGAENVLYGEQGSIGDWIRRPTETRPVASLGAVAFALCFMFPALFLLRAVVFRLWDPTPLQALLRGAVVQVFLFAFFPLALAAFRKTDFRTGFSLRPFRWFAIPAALVLGCCLWPFAFEIALWAQEHGLGIDPSSMEEIKKVVERFGEQTSAFAGLLVLAIVPAVTEELFFRGYVLQAMKNRLGVGQAILLSSILFGGFHLVTEAPLISRFLTTTALGLALGFVAWRSGSVIPGMLLHAINNACVIILLHYRSWFESHGIGIEEERHFPALWLGIAGGCSLVAFAFIWFSGRNREPEPGALELESPI